VHTNMMHVYDQSALHGLLSTDMMHMYGMHTGIL